MHGPLFPASSVQTKAMRQTDEEERAYNLHPHAVLAIDQRPDNRRMALYETHLRSL